MVEVKLRSGRPRKLSDRTAHRFAIKENREPPFDWKRPSGRFSRLWSGCAQFDWAVTPAENMIFMEESSGENLSYHLTSKFSIRHSQRNIYTSLMHFGNVSCRLMNLKQNLLAVMSKDMFKGNRVQNLMKRTALQLVSTVGDQSCFGLVLQPLAKGTFHWQREEWMQLNTSKFWKQTSHPSKKLEMKRVWLLQENNDPKHTSKSTMDYLKSCMLEVLP